MVKSTLRELSMKAVIRFRSRCITPRPGMVERARQLGAQLKLALWGWEPKSPIPGHLTHTHLSDDGLKNLRNER
jgi:hypothetical protein